MAKLLFAPAGLTPSQDAARTEQAGAQLESAAALVQALRELHHHLLVAAPDYVVSDTYSFGGPTTTPNGAYGFSNVFNTPAQYRVVQMTFTAAGTALVSQQRGIAAPGTTTTLDPSAMIDRQVFAAPGALTMCGSDGWTDIPGNATVYLAVTVTSGAAYAVVQFRRRVSPGGVYAEGHD